MKPGSPAHIRPATPADAAACIQLRGRTRENAISAERLAQLGITAHSWAAGIASGELPGFICTTAEGEMVGYCFGAASTGEVVVLALLPAYEGQGIGRALLGRVVALLRQQGHTRLFLGCSPDPAVRSHGFYRRLGWRSTGSFDDHGDELLELLAPAGARTTPAAATTTMQLAAVRVFVPDLEPAARFYGQALGLPLRAGSPQAGYLVFAAGTCDLVVEPVPPAAPPGDQALVGRFTGLSLRVDDLAAVHTQLLARGVPFSSPPQRQAWGGLLATLQDPAGNQLQLVQYPAAG